MSGFLRASLILLLLCTATVSYAQSAETLHCLKHGLLQEEQTYKNYTVRVLRESASCFEIRKGAKRIHAEGGRMVRYALGSMYPNDPKSLPIKMGQTITGDRQPNLVVVGWSGGAHCCFEFEVFQIGDEFRKLARLEVKDADLSHFEDTYDNGKFVFVTNDFTFGYWRTSFQDSPAPEVRLSYQNGEYRLARDLMVKAPPSSDAYQRSVTRIRALDPQPDGAPPPELWGQMLDLIYSGNATLSEKFLDESWNPAWGNKEEFRAGFRARLRQSPYWPQLKLMRDR